MPSDLAKLFCAMSACCAPETRSDAPPAPLLATLEPVIENQGPKVLSSVPLRKRSATIATLAKRLPLIVRRSIGYQPFGSCSPVPETTTPIAEKSLFVIVTSSAKVPGAMTMPSRRPLPGPRTDTRSSAML